MRSVQGLFFLVKLAQSWGRNVFRATENSLSGQSRYQMFSYKFLALFGSQLLSAVLAHQTTGESCFESQKKFRLSGGLFYAVGFFLVFFSERDIVLMGNFTPKNLVVGCSYPG